MKLGVILDVENRVWLMSSESALDPLRDDTSISRDYYLVRVALRL